MKLLNLKTRVAKNKMHHSAVLFDHVEKNILSK